MKETNYSIIEINGQKIGKGEKPFIVAEMSGNHNGSINNALNIIKTAKECGADAVKIQTYTPDTITIDCNRPEFIINEGIWKGRRLYELYQEAHTPWEWHEELFKYARNIGITLFSTPFDKSSVSLLEKLNNPIYKIASPELIDLGLIKEVAKTGKPIIFSTGMGSLDEIEEAIETVKNVGSNKIIVLHCTSAYPAPIEEANLSTIPEIENRFKVLSGLSDHTKGTEVSKLAVVLGAAVIEKHFTLDKTQGGVDSEFSIDPTDLKRLVNETKTASICIGKPAFKPTKSESMVLKNRRSLYIVKDIKKGEIIQTENIKSIRPGNGILPKYIDSIIGKIASRDLYFGEPFGFDMIIESKDND